MGDNLEKIIYCRSCDQKLKQQELQRRIDEGMERRRKSFKSSAWITALILTVFFIIACSVNATIGEIIIGSIICLMFFPFISCLYLDNNCIIFIFAVLGLKVIKLPAIIFAFSLDGFIGFIVLKLIFAVISAIIAFFTTLFALAVCLVLSVFVYPFALRKNKLHPEITSI